MFEENPPEGHKKPSQGQFEELIPTQIRENKNKRELIIELLVKNNDLTSLIRPDAGIANKDAKIELEYLDGKGNRQSMLIEVAQGKSYKTDENGILSIRRELPLNKKDKIDLVKITIPGAPRPYVHSFSIAAETKDIKERVTETIKDRTEIKEPKKKPEKINILGKSSLEIISDSEAILKINVEAKKVKKTSSSENVTVICDGKTIIKDQTTNDLGQFFINDPVPANVKNITINIGKDSLTLNRADLEIINTFEINKKNREQEEQRAGQLRQQEAQHQRQEEERTRQLRQQEEQRRQQEAQHQRQEEEGLRPIREREAQEHQARAAAEAQQAQARVREAQVNELNRQNALAKSRSVLQNLIQTQRIDFEAQERNLEDEFRQIHNVIRNIDQGQVPQTSFGMIISQFSLPLNLSHVTQQDIRIALDHRLQETTQNLERIRDLRTAINAIPRLNPNANEENMQQIAQALTHALSQITNPADRINRVLQIIDALNPIRETLDKKQNERNHKILKIYQDFIHKIILARRKEFEDLENLHEERERLNRLIQQGKQAQDQINATKGPNRSSQLPNLEELQQIANRGREAQFNLSGNRKYANHTKTLAEHIQDQESILAQRTYTRADIVEILEQWIENLVHPNLIELSAQFTQDIQRISPQTEGQNLIDRFAAIQTELINPRNP